MLRERDYREVLSAIHNLNEPRSLDDFRLCARRIASQLVECERACFSEVEFQSGRVLVGLLEPVSSRETRELYPVMTQLLHENPLLQHFEARPESATRISDFLSARQWRRTALYNEVYRHIDAEEQMLLSVGSQRETMACITIHRNHRTFSQRDRLRLEALRPHLVQGYRNARCFSQTQHEMLQNRALYEAMTDRVLVVAKGRIVFCSDHARQILRRYFGETSALLPSPIARWLQLQNAMSLQVAAPFRLKKAAQALLVRRVGNGEDGALLSLEEVEEARRENRSRETFGGLTDRQSEVSRLLSRGLTNAQIASHLHISAHTVRHHLEAIYDKLGVCNRNAAAECVRQSCAANTREQ